MADDNSSEKNSQDVGFVAGLANLGIVKQLGVMVGVAASVAIGMGVVLWSQDAEYRVLYNNVDYAESNQILTELDNLGIKHTFNGNSKTILVEADKLHEARLKLAEGGYGGDGIVGYESIDGGSPMGSSANMESARLKRALEGELARTISGMRGVKSARVHLALPKQSSFIRNKVDPRASVFVDLNSGKKLDAQQISAISSVVAMAVPTLDLKNVSVVDQNGRLLSNESENDEIVKAAKQVEYTRSIEETLVNRVNSILQPIVGYGNFRAEVSANIDFTESERADEVYTSDPQAVRSEQVLVEKRGTAIEPGGVPGALSNRPPSAAEAPENINAETLASASKNSSSREQSVKNYEVDKTISYTKTQSGTIKRLSVAVVVNNSDSEGEENSEAREWTTEDLAMLEGLVKNAVGFEESRGDSVTVINSTFYKQAETPEVEPEIWEESWFWSLVKQGFAGLAILIIILGVLRPILKGIVARPKENQITAEDIRLELKAEEEANEIYPKFEEQLDEIVTMIDKDPAKVAQAVRQWVTETEKA